MLSKLIFPKLFYAFEISHNNATENNSTNYHINSNNNNHNNNTILNSSIHNKNNSFNISNIEIVLNKFEKIFEINSINENEDFVQNVLSILPKLDELINFYTNNNNNWRNIKKISLILCFDNIYKFNQNLDNYVNKIFNISKKLFNNECFEIKIDSVKILAKICKNKTIWEDVIKFVEVEILTNKNYYNRRLYFYFFQELTKNFSYKFLNEKGQIDELMKLMNDNNQIFPKFLKLINIFFPLVVDDKIKFLIYNKLEILRKQINNKEIIDKEVIQVRSFFKKIPKN